MPGLLPSTDKMEKQITALGEKIEDMATAMVTAQQKVVTQNETIISLLTEMRDATVRPSDAGNFTEDEIRMFAETWAEQGEALTIPVTAYKDRPVPHRWFRKQEMPGTEDVSSGSNNTGPMGIPSSADM